MPDPITTADGERIQTDEERAVEALVITIKRSDTSLVAIARAILAAIRDGKVPIPGMVTAEVWKAAEAHIDRLKADIEGKDAALMRARVYGRDKDHRELAAERDQLRATVSGLTKAFDDMESMADHNAVVAKEQKDRTEKAESRHAEAVALLRRIADHCAAEDSHDLSREERRQAMRQFRDEARSFLDACDGKGVGG